MPTRTIEATRVVAVEVGEPRHVPPDALGGALTIYEAPVIEIQLDDGERVHVGVGSRQPEEDLRRACVELRRALGVPRHG